MKTIVILLALMSVAHADTIRDSMGRTLGRTERDGKGNTTFYDAMGRETGRSVTQGGRTIIYDNMGRRTGTVDRR